MSRRFQSATYRCTEHQRRRNRLLITMLALLLAAGGCRTARYTAASLPQQLRASPAQASNAINLSRIARTGSSTSRIGPGDLLKVTIASGIDDKPPQPVEIRVTDDGTALVPLIGPVHVAGLEPFQAEQRVASAAAERGIYRQPYVTLIVAEQAVNRVTVLGAVAKPGVYELPRGASDLVNALGAAGGFADEAGTEVEVLHQRTASFLANGSTQRASAAPGHVAVASYNEAAPPLDSPELASPLGEQQTSRAIGTFGQAAPRTETVRINLAQAGQADDANCELGDRDVVMVLPQEERYIHVTGLVARPNQFEIPQDQDIRLLDAIAMAGGTSSPVADKVYVIRQWKGMPQPAIVEASIDKAKQNGDDNLLLAPGDLVSVETTLTTTIVDTAKTFFRIAVGWSGNMATF
jgi:polysaccharide export outer membrane protein